MDGVDLDGTVAAVADGMAWQPGFFRAVHDEIGVRIPLNTSARSATGCAPARVGPAARLSVFGPTRISESFRQLLTATAGNHDVHLYLRIRVRCCGRRVPLRCGRTVHRADPRRP